MTAPAPGPAHAMEGPATLAPPAATPRTRTLVRSGTDRTQRALGWLVWAFLVAVLLWTGR